MIKRLFDFFVALLVLLSLWPVLVIVAILIRCKLGSPIFFKQERPGKDGQPFMMCKFRTMTDGRDENGQLLPDDQRMTKFGNFLRSSSLDEFPELINVLKGNMSLVGPRPLLMEYLGHYSPEQERRHEARPGITGWAQVNGRNKQSWEDRLAMDVWYVDNQSLWLDLKILFLTVYTVVNRKGVSADGHVTMPKFNEMNDKG